MANDHPGFTHWSPAEALAKGPPPGNLATPIFSRGSLEVELYAPDGRDPQRPHRRDEVDVVARGTGVFLVGDGRYAVGPGSFLFVAAGRPHRFEDFSPDFAVWVTRLLPSLCHATFRPTHAVRTPLVVLCLPVYPLQPMHRGLGQ